MAAPIRFDGRVVLVTGAGGGLGKQYALGFAARGASVVVNDLGGDPKGEGKSSRAADLVVEEIRSKGGKAVADYNSVEDGEKVVQTALDAFGRIDIVINNAGILRDKSFARISDLDWDLIQRVHLRGSFLVTRAAWPHMKKQKFGRIIMTTSTSGLFGNFGQANYSAAKMGLVGLSNTLSLEGVKYNIYCNSIAPIAGSRLTQGIMTPEMVEELKPEYIVPLVMYLCSESCEENGAVFQSVAGWHSKLRWQRSKGKLLHRRGTEVTAEMIRDNWDDITDWTGAENPTPQDAQAVLMQVIEKKNSDRDGTSSGESRQSSFSYTHRDVILYALGVGVAAKEDYSHLKFLYEGHEDFSVLPTFGVLTGMEVWHLNIKRKFEEDCGIRGMKRHHASGLLLGFNQGGMSEVFAKGELAGIKFDLSRLLHGEQYIELFKPFPTSGTLTTKTEVADVLDKGKGALILLNVTTLDEEGETLCLNQSAIYLGGSGGFGGKRNSDKAKPLVNAPSRKPDASLQEKTGVTQAALYRLSGDYNPLHVDPAFAQMGRFSAPILHGLCSFGIACRHVLNQYANDDVTKFKAMKARFAKPVIPGQTLQTDMWREGNRIHIQCKVVENGNAVLSGGYVDLVNITQDVPDVKDLISKPSSSGLKSEVLFQELKKRIASHPELVKKVKGIFQWNVTKNGKTLGQWVIDLKTGSGAVIEGISNSLKPDCTITVSDDDLIGLATGKLNAQQLFMKGKLKVTGNIMLTVNLDKLFKEQSKM